MFVLHTVIQWEYLPQELGFGSGMTCWRRLAAWNEAGVWDRLHAVMLTKLRAAKPLDWSRAVINSSHVRAARRGPKADPARSTAHGRAASTTSSSTDRASRSRCLLEDRDYDHDKYRRLVWAQGIKPVIARRGVPHGSGLGVHRWVVERTIAWFHGFRRLRVRWERRDDIHEAFLGIATCLITHRHVQRLC
ncbi:transposase [Streptomyces sp. WAC05292]|nr:transposase [Streptomyces sp. WAC05292]